MNFSRVFHYKPSILGYPYFWKHPLISFFCFWKPKPISFHPHSDFQGSKCVQNISSRPVRIALSLRVLLDSTIVNYKLDDFFLKMILNYIYLKVEETCYPRPFVKIRLVWICPPLPSAMSPPGVGQTGGRQSIGKRLFGALT